MQFKHPELLYALFLLLIPIIVHLFQLRKFQKEAFTNVAFLKEVTLQTRKSSQLKKWLTLLTRLLLLACIILAFAQPFTAKTNAFKTKSETVIYLDNSFSMQAKGDQGDLLKRAVQDIISNVPENNTISLLTNDNTYKNTSIKAIKNDLLQMEYSAKSFTYEAALLKAKTLFSKDEGSLKHMVFISDFQQQATHFNPTPDSLTNILAVKLEPVNINNVSIDSAYISNATASNFEITVALKQTGTSIENLPVSLYNDDQLIAKTSVAINNNAKTTFSLPTNTIINGKISIDDTGLQYDNDLFFNINNVDKINVLSINEENDSFLKRIFTENEFNYTSATVDQLNFNDLEKQNLIVLNELKTIPNTLVSVLKTFTDQGGYITIIPAKDITTSSYNELLQNFGTRFTDFVASEKHITTINYSHPIYSNGVFENEVKNFQYPQIQSFYNLSKQAGSSVLQFEDNKPFLVQSKNAFIFTAALNNDNSNFKNSPLIVPTLYNMAKNSFKVPSIYYTIGQDNSFDVDVQLNQDDIVSIVNTDLNIIPKQQYFNNKVLINTFEDPAISGIYTIKNKNENIQNVSYNYNRTDSDLIYQDLSNLNNITLSDSVTDSFDIIKSDTNINALWKWFAIFALVFLIIEMLILKYFK
ncbi:vWA domain-containing protein [Confluentibacter citreus]|uniref:vWA domain-containing protein n=1 Tax=Confluentibacter citreus TaxID=2007307 RepID=UPI000C2819AD|nr:BatA and WFA domain-containing protein [Confluentibacter citreus]